METKVKWLAASALIGAIAALPVFTAAQYLGQLSANPNAPDSTANPNGVYGSPFSPNSNNNPYGVSGSPLSAKSANNPFTTQAPRLYDRSGEYRGKLSSNPF